MSEDPPKHDWLPPAEPRGPSPESPSGWQPPPGQQQQGGWGQAPPTYVQPPGGGANGKATASLVLGICGLVVCPLICSILALVFGYQARKEIDSTGSGQGSRGNATAGIVLGWIGTIISVLGIALIVVLALAGELDDSYDEDVDDSFDEFSAIRVLAATVARAAILATG